MYKGRFEMSSLLDFVVGSRLRAGLLSALLVGTSLAATARGPAQMVEQAPSQDMVALAELPAQARTVYRLILQGGPFRHDKDGSVFGNRERLLPAKRRGYYLEYTVDTPGLGHRGARRLVCGGPAQTPDACYYSSDHYASFRRLVPVMQQ